MTKGDILQLLKSAAEDSTVIVYDGDDKIYKLSFYGNPTPNELWLKVEFDTTVEDLDG